MTACVLCRQPLTLRVDDDDEDEDMDDPGASSSNGSYVDDDVHLPCGCHLHWQCLLDASYEVTACPNCKSNIVSTDSEGQQKVLCNLKNEGGLQEGLDLLPILTEESYLRAYPEDRKSRAFLQLCADGDVDMISDLLKDDDDDEDGNEEESISTSAVAEKDILRYQDQLGSMNSALHLAVLNQRVEATWLLLLLASNMDVSTIPSEVMSAAQALGLERSDQTGKTDIRALKDGEGMTAYDRAKELGGVWESWLKEGAFTERPLLMAP